MRRCGLAACLALALTACETTLPPDRALAPADDLLGGGASRESVIQELTTVPVRCVDVPRGDLCEWHVSPGEAAHPKLARRLGIDDALAALCLFGPEAGAAPAEGRCTLHQRRSNRNEFAVSSRAQARMGASARNRLNAARSPVAMSRLLGQAPQFCTPVVAGRECVWRLTNQSYGHGTVARVVGTEYRRQVRWSCAFPEDGARPTCEGAGL